MAKALKNFIHVIGLEPELLHTSAQDEMSTCCERRHARPLAQRRGVEPRKHKSRQVEYGSFTPRLQPTTKPATRDHLRPAQSHVVKEGVPKPGTHAPTPSQPGTFSLAP